jgi:type IX secretion system PorP/SprF family membrane protein
MNNKKHLIILFIFIGSTILLNEKGYAQQHPIFTQYMFNGLVLNPAYSGSHESMTLAASLRRQWTGIKGAPQTEVFTAHTPLGFTRSAAGMVLTHDHVGVTNQYMVYGTYAYHIPVSTNAKISVGGQAGATYYNTNLTDLDIVTSNNAADPAFANNTSRFLPNIGMGIYYYSKTTYAGLSLPTVIDNKWYNKDPLIKARQERHYFLTAGHVFDLSPSLKLKPNVLLKWVEHGPFQYDVNANLLIQEVLWVGVSYRMKDSVDGILEWIINDQMRLGYSYGYPTSAISSYQYGTHEIVLNFSLKQNKNIVFSPRYF